MPTSLELLDSTRMVIDYAERLCSPATVLALYAVMARIAKDADLEGKPIAANSPMPPLVPRTIAQP